jgi:hypothetical protein
MMEYCEPNHFRFTSTDTLQIECVRWDQRGTLRGVVQIAHGLGEHIGRYAELADLLTRGDWSFLETTIADTVGQLNLHNNSVILGRLVFTSSYKI